MKTALFIASRIIKGELKGKKVSKPVVRISLVSVSLGLAVMILTVSVVRGFQHQVRDKVIGFGGHVKVMSAHSDSYLETQPMEVDPQLMQDIEGLDGVNHVQRFGFLPGIIQSGRDSVHYSVTLNGEKVDTVKVQQQIQGVMVKGVGPEHDWKFIEQHLVHGEVTPYADTGAPSPNLYMSDQMAKSLHFEVGDRFRLYFIDKDGPKPRSMELKGTFNTGFVEFDREMVFADIRHVQHQSGWGVRGSLVVLDTCQRGWMLVKASAAGGTGSYRFDTGNGFQDRYIWAVDPSRDTTLQVIIGDFRRDAVGLTMDGPIAIPDTVSISFTSGGADCICEEGLYGDIERKVLDDDGYHYQLKFPTGIVEVRHSKNPGSGYHYAGGLELQLEDWKALNESGPKVAQALDNPYQKAELITQSHPDIFHWLEFLDINVWIILVLMVVVAVINMISALLVLVLEKTNMIGVLKALGATNGQIRRVFLLNAAYLISWGLLWGNLIGIGFAWMQQEFQFISLNPDVYYMDHAPILLEWQPILLLNLGTMAVILLFLLLPSLVISRVDPAKAIRFN